MSLDLVASFPAAGSGGSTLEQLTALAVRRGMGHVALANPPTISALESGHWRSETVEELRRAAKEQSADRVILFGHCMGGLSALRLAAGLEAELGLPVALLVVNAPCPDADGRIPTMTEFSDAQIAEVLAHDGFPQELLDDEDLLEEIADGLRADARVADRLAEWVSGAGPIDALYVLSTRGDMFIPPEQCSGWQHRVSRSFHLSVVEGGHALDESVVGALEAAVDGVLAELNRAAESRSTESRTDTE